MIVRISWYSLIDIFVVTFSRLVNTSKHLSLEILNREIVFQYINFFHPKITVTVNATTEKRKKRKTK